MSKDLAASVRARLLNIAKAEGSDFNQVLVRFALERMLYRRSQSAHADHFLLKGALLFALWYDLPHRHTRDADLPGFGPVTSHQSRRPFATLHRLMWTTESYSIRPALRWRRSEMSQDMVECGC